MLTVVGAYPDPEPELPTELLRTTSEYPGMSVRTANGRMAKQDDTDGFYDEATAARLEGERYLLRWETLGANRDRPRDEIPPPSELWLYILGR